ncbi:MAG TPA: L,D-transpeptidase family protein, partial [Acidimicrobiia bacterium]
MRRSLLALAVASILSACGAPAQMAPVVEPPRASTAASVVTPSTTTPVAESASPVPVFGGMSTANLQPHRTLVAMTVGDTEVYESNTTLHPILTMPHTTILGTITVLEVVEGPVDGWARVRLPVRPNGTEGWVQAEDLMLYVVDSQVMIDLSDRTLTYFEKGEPVLTTPVAIGSKRNPTPVGEFFITDSVTLANPDSAWGPHAFGLSARSETITEYNGGDGIIGIHGTNRPGSIGNAASL